MIWRDAVKKVGFGHVILVVAVLAVLGMFAVWLSDRGKGGVPAPAIGDLARCLQDRGVRMYGTEWCSHCQKQKKAFGESFSMIDYVECTDSGNPMRMSAECERAGITGFPTWQFSLGNLVPGEMSFSELAAKAGCPWGEMGDPDSFVVSSPPVGPDTEGTD
ncbi:hypothetical protein JW899_03210 [Candidatus Uhrbacteria bacterium]|nr:hypothetical protein [Candidatus Uhrbacteria bacterium]